MAIRELIGIGLGCGLVFTTAVSACSGKRQTPSTSPLATASPGSAQGASTQADAGTAATPATSGTSMGTSSAQVAEADPQQVLLAQAKAAQRCEQPHSKILNGLDGGVIFNNAMTSADAGSLDRSQLILNAIDAQERALRCCFDTWLSTHPNAVGTLMLKIQLGADGDVTAASVDGNRSTDPLALTDACVIDVAKHTTFPASPSNRPTLVERMFRFEGGVSAAEMQEAQ